MWPIARTVECKCSTGTENSSRLGKALNSDGRGRSPLRRTGRLYVVDGGDLNPWPPDRAQLLQVDTKGNILGKWSGYGNYDGQLYWPHDIAVGNDGAVYTGEILGRRAQKFVPR